MGGFYCPCTALTRDEEARPRPRRDCRPLTWWDLERTTGFEPATLTLATSWSTPLSRPSAPQSIVRSSPTLDWDLRRSVGDEAESDQGLLTELVC
jgi:hypothetical protein